jgi:predicted translin family RNA/ssDNA-binding protein
MRLGKGGRRERAWRLAREIHLQFQRLVTALHKRLARGKSVLALAKLYDPG